MLLVCIPLYLVSLFMNQASSRTVEKDISESTQSHLQFYVNSLEAEMNHLSKMKKDFLLDDDVQNLSTIAPAMNDYEIAKSILRVENRLTVLKESSVYVREAKIYIPLLNHTIYSSSYEAAMNEQEFRFISDHADKLPVFYFKPDDRLLMSQIYPDPLSEGRSPTFALEIDLSIGKIRDILSQISSDKGEVLLVSNDGEWSVYENPTDPAAKMVSSDLLRNKEIAASGERLVKIGNLPYFVFYQSSSVLNATIACYLPEQEIMGPLHTYRLWFWALSILSIFIILLSSYWTYSVIHRPLVQMVQAFRRVQKGDLAISIEHRWEDEFGYLYAQFNKMADRLSTLIQEVYEQKIRNQRAELKQLQAQINPHFLYNSFFILYRMARVQDHDNIARMTRHLSEYFQFVARSAADEVPLEREVSHARAYAEIQSFRFRTQLSIEFGELPESCRSVAVPRLILQPVLENAFQYGLEQREKDGLLRVAFREEGDGTVLTVEDNGEMLTEADLTGLQALLQPQTSDLETTGLLNVHRRLQMKFGDQGGLSLSRSELGGLRVDIHIPIARGEGHVSDFAGR
nr:histidine kinase [Cohnella zeiphila]